ncbi:molybdopterin molybdotransferase MoeA [Aliifodinibius sp. S!AR15-10]|uniref:molybdopterin molybdotransferase MoeA n=1 Tax=Aliifodinibius sp. S!AR15-10 TaxID=2950437 RepID=UPI0028645F35|nr:molybdopterin molybdotransferase MoeA [Aliifodinibius sp. S!AR15-10]MDR8394137.1 molybdopterin molybdotransferase MoeA [Aliifodinibius sp. S!AR15-10]
MITVPKAAELIDSVTLKVSVKEVPISQAVGMVLRESLRSDRDLPPFDRVMMDGIAIRFEQWKKGQRSFPVEGLQKAGASKQSLKDNQHCLEVMTGSILPGNTDTVIRYEDIKIEQQNGEEVAVIRKGPKEKRQNIHAKGTNRAKGDLVVEEGTVLSPAEIGVAATFGKSMLKVSDPPRVAVISTGNELVEIDQQPLPHQIRRSNAYTLAAALKETGVEADLFHLNDDRDEISEKLDHILDQYNLLIMSGGVSKGKLDYIPELLEKKGIEKLFHKVRQRPGKPFWFGRSEQAVVFALPGNPVSSFSCYYRYVEPWVKKQLGMREVQRPFARLTEEFSFSKDLTYFLQVRIHMSEDGTMEATPVKGKGSSDLANLCRGDGLLELPEERDDFGVEESYPLYLYRGF